MKTWLIIFLVLTSACQSPQTVNNNPGPVQDTPAPVIAQPHHIHKQLNWKGTIGSNIPVFIHYTIDSNIIIGNIIYLNTLQQKPITLLGKIDKDKSYRLLEFDSTGNITGIITGSTSGEGFSGSWFSPETRKELAIQLSPKDTVITTGEPWVKPSDMNGQYRYQYSKDGASGIVNIHMIDSQQIAFSINAVTSPPAYNMADVRVDTVAISGTRFRYLLPGTKDCDFEIRIFNGFLSVDYLHGGCGGQFGNNATVEGIFLKVSGIQ